MVFCVVLSSSQSLTLWGQRCRAVAMVFLGLRRQQQSTLLHAHPRQIVLMIARLVWATHGDVVWEPVLPLAPVVADYGLEVYKRSPEVKRGSKFLRRFVPSSIEFVWE